MAGYVMTLGKEGKKALEKCVESGVYSTDFKLPNNGKWNAAHEGTFADYLSMKAGDNIYFFTDRYIYGVGEIVNVGEECAYLNFKNADLPTEGISTNYSDLKPLLDEYYTNQNRCFCTFKPSPYFFMKGVEMDDALNSNPDKFRMLRVMWKVSFIKIDDEENKALLDIILKRNEVELLKGKDVYPFNLDTHKKIQEKVETCNRMRAYALLAKSASDEKVGHEMAIEAALCRILSHESHPIFGDKWDYVSHQVAASPFKPVDYMDKMDIFGYRYISGYKTISKYMVVEIKKDEAEPSVIDQIMKYVDWVNVEYAHGDYSMIEAYVVASDFSDSVVEKKNRDAIRGYVKGYRPAKSSSWTNVRLVKYSYVDGRLCFTEVK